jgi:hypothetical protein
MAMATTSKVLRSGLPVAAPRAKRIRSGACMVGEKQTN